MLLKKCESIQISFWEKEFVSLEIIYLWFHLNLQMQNNLNPRNSQIHKIGARLNIVQKFTAVQSVKCNHTHFH